MQQFGHIALYSLLSVSLVGGLYAAGQSVLGTTEYERPGMGTEPTLSTTTPDTVAEITPEPVWPAPLDRERYDELLLDLADYQPPMVSTTSTSSPAVSDLVYSSSTNVTVRGSNWPAAAPYPHGGAILPFNRIVAYYGNFYSRNMGILGEYDPAEVTTRLASTSRAYEAADPDTPVVPAIHYIAMVAQADAGADGMYRNVMPDEHIEKGYTMAKAMNGILFLDLQVGLSTIQRELPQFREYLTRPEVHLGIDPEFAMAPSGAAPGTVIGTYDARDINFVIDWLSEIVREHELPPKVLVIHRFTQNMVTNVQDIKPTPEVQVVLHMDGWGSKQLKRNTYRNVVLTDPLQFAGLKIFYKNDRKPPSTGIFTPQEAVALHPEPVYIQYQ